MSDVIHVVLQQVYMQTNCNKNCEDNAVKLQFLYSYNYGIILYHI